MEIKKDWKYGDIVKPDDMNRVEENVGALNDQLDGHSVQSDVPADAKFTDTVVGIQNNLVSTLTDEALSAAQGKDLNDKITAINTRLGTGDSSAYMTVNTGWSGTNVSSFQINQLHKVGKMVELDLALTFKVEQAAGVRPQIGTISSGILPRCEISVPTSSFAPNATNPNGTANAELRITTDGKVHWYNSTASSIPANGGMKAHVVWITK